METVVLGQGVAGGTHFADAASAEDDLGGGRIYAALVKQAMLKRTGQADAGVRQLRQGSSDPEDLTLGAGGAIIADTSDKTNIPFQVVCPVGFAEDLSAEILRVSGTTMALCTISDFLDCFITISDSYSVSHWDEFSEWFDGYRGYLNDSIQTANMRITSLDGIDYAGTCRQMGKITKISDVFSWLKSCMPSAMLLKPTSEITADNNEEKIGMIVTMTNMSGSYEALVGSSSAVMHFYIRL